MTSHPSGPRRSILKLLLKAMKGFALRVGGSGLSFLFALVITRQLGAQSAGLYFLAFSLMMILSVVTRLGFDGTIMRFIAHHAALQEWGKVKGAFLAILSIVGGVSVVIGIMVVLSADFLAVGVFGKPDLAAPMLWLGLAMVPLNQIRLISSALKGLDKLPTGEAVGSLLQPLFGVALLYPLVMLWGVKGGAIAFLVSSSIAALLGWLFWRRHKATSAAQSETIELRKLFRSARPLWISSTANQAIIPWAPVALLGFWSSTADVGIFGAATRLANLIAVFLIGVNAVLAPQFSRMQAMERPQDIGPLARQFAMIVTLISIPFFCILVFSASWVMGLFGPEFQDGGAVLAILAIGQLTSALCGSARMVLIMTGHETGLRDASMISLLTLLLFAVLLIPTYGALGAAITSALGLFTSNALSVIIIWRKMNIMVVPGLNKIFKDKQQGL